MGQVSNESQRPTSRRQRTRRAPEARRREARAAAESRRAARNNPRSAGEGAERFVAGEHGTAASRDTGAAKRPATDAPRPGSGARSGGRLSRVWHGWWSTWGEHIRRFAPVVLVNHAVTLAVTIAVAVIIGIGETFTAVPAMVGSFWMFANLAPVGFAGAELGVAPLLPAALIVLAHSRRVRAACGSQITVRNIRVFATLAVLVPVVLTCLAWLVLWDASKVFDIAPPNILVAVASTAVVNGLAFVVGLGPKVWRALLLRRGWPTWPVEGARLAGRFVRWMLLAGLLAVVVQLLLNIGALSDAYSIAPDAWGRIGLTVLSLLYLPNLAVGASGVLMGSEMHIGDASASLFAVTNANLPPMPILAAMPNTDLPYGEALLVIPVAVAVFTVYRFFVTRSFMEAPVFTALAAGAFAAVAGLLVAWAAGGTLGLYGSTGPLLGLTPLLFACWMVVPALVVFIWLARAGQRVTETAQDVEDSGSIDPEADAEVESDQESDAETDAEAGADAGAEGEADAEDESEADGAAGEPGDDPDSEPGPGSEGEPVPADDTDVTDPEEPEAPEAPEEPEDPVEPEDPEETDEVEPDEDPGVDPGDGTDPSGAEEDEPGTDESRA